jgi:hypothetical protein
MAHRYVYKPSGSTYEAAVDKKRCRASVHNDYGVGSHQCGRKAKVFDPEGLGWCTQHSPEKDAERKAKSSAKADNWVRTALRATAVKAIGEAYAGGMAESKKAAEAAAHAAWRKHKKALDKSE